MCALGHVKKHHQDTDKVKLTRWAAGGRCLATRSTGTSQPGLGAIIESWWGDGGCSACGLQRPVFDGSTQERIRKRNSNQERPVGCCCCPVRLRSNSPGVLFGIIKVVSQFSGFSDRERWMGLLSFRQRLNVAGARVLRKQTQINGRWQKQTENKNENE